MLKIYQKEHPSLPRNKLIAAVFYSMRLIETWGTGTNRMIEVCKEEGIPEPIFKEAFGGILVTFTFKSPIGSTAIASKPAEDLTERQQALLEIIKKHGEISMDRILSELPHPPSRRMLQRDLNQLKNKGIVTLSGYGRNATWKYNNRNAT